MVAGMLKSLWATGYNSTDSRPWRFAMVSSLGNDLDRTTCREVLWEIRKNQENRYLLDFVRFVRHLYGKFMEKICLKAP